MVIKLTVVIIVGYLLLLSTWYKIFTTILVWRLSPYID
jgi:hypothetical protein